MSELYAAELQRENIVLREMAHQAGSAVQPPALVAVNTLDVDERFELTETVLGCDPGFYLYVGEPRRARLESGIPNAVFIYGDCELVIPASTRVRKIRGL